MSERQRVDSLLDRRSLEVLRVVIREHVRTGQPVSSRSVSKSHSEKLSPATIRNLMADLTDAGYLMQPHTSAGRVPTERAYRYFADEIVAQRTGLPRREARKIERILVSSREIDELLGQTGKLLSTMTQQVGVVVAPDLERSILEHVEFVRIAPSRVVAIFVSRSGLVTHRVIDTDEDLAQPELDAISQRLRNQFSGMTLPEARRRLIAALREEREWVEALGARASSAVAHFLEEPFPEESGELILEGTSQLLGAQEFADLDRLRSVMQLFEERTRLVGLLDRCLGAPGVQVIFGSESNDPGLEPIALVASSYRAGEAMKGLVGIVGPRRMEYARAVSVVDHFARLMSVRLGSGDPGKDEA